MICRSIRTFLLYFISTALKSDKQFQKQVIFFLIYKDQEPDRNHSSGFRGQMAGQLTITKQMKLQLKKFSLIEYAARIYWTLWVQCYLPHTLICLRVCHVLHKKKKMDKERFNVHFLYFSDCSETENTKITTPLTRLQSTWSSQLFEMKRHVLLYAHTAHNFSLKMLGFQKKSLIKTIFFPKPLTTIPLIIDSFILCTCPSDLKGQWN